MPNIAVSFSARNAWGAPAYDVRLKFPEPKRKHWREHLSAVARLYRVSEAGILSDCRRHEFTRPRHHLMTVLRDEGRSYPQIGQLLGRDHTTVIAGVRAHRRRMGA